MGYVIIKISIKSLPNGDKKDSLYFFRTVRMDTFSVSPFPFPSKFLPPKQRNTLSIYLIHLKIFVQKCVLEADWLFEYCELAPFLQTFLFSALRLHCVVDSQAAYRIQA